METIKSFQVDHERLKPGVYVARVDKFGEGLLSGKILTLDLRFTRPNREPPMDQAALHTIEHLGATFLRNDPDHKNSIVYFGPMGCRTGFYLLLWQDNFSSRSKIAQLIKDMCKYILDYSGEIPGAKINQCGNYLEHNLEMAKYYTQKFLDSISISYQR